MVPYGDTRENEILRSPVQRHDKLTITRGSQEWQSFEKKKYSAFQIHLDLLLYSLQFGLKYSDIKYAFVTESKHIV